MKEIRLTMKVPFNLIGEKILFNIPDSNSSGIYFFTIRVNNRYLIEYVGITTRRFKDRFLEHIRELLSGGYKLYDFQKLKNNEQFVVWNRRYGKDTDDIAVFLNNYQSFSKIIKQQLQELKIFLIPFNTEKRILERIEGAIYQILIKNNDERVMTFIKGVRSNPTRKDEDSINIMIESNTLSSEIPNEFEIKIS